MLTQPEVDKQIEIFQQQHVAKIIARMSTGEPLNPEISILRYDIPGQRFTVSDIPVPGECMEPEFRGILFSKVIPAMFKFHHDEFQQVICFSFASEVWIWKTESTGDKATDDANARKGPRTEAISITFECEAYEQMITYPITRPGGKVTLGEKIVIDSRNETQEMSGRMSGIFRKFNRVKIN